MGKAIAKEGKEKEVSDYDCLHTGIHLVGFCHSGWWGVHQGRASTGAPLLPLHSCGPSCPPSPSVVPLANPPPLPPCLSRCCKWQWPTPAARLAQLKVKPGSAQRRPLLPSSRDSSSQRASLSPPPWRHPPPSPSSSSAPALACSWNCLFLRRPGYGREAKIRLLRWLRMKTHAPKVGTPTPALDLAASRPPGSS